MRHVLANIQQPEHPDLLVGVNTIDDAGVFRLSEDLALVQTVDFFTPIIDDPYTYGAISVSNSLSDVYAMGGQPLTALNIVCYPKALVSNSMLAEILRGGYDKAAEADCLIIGGHTVEDNEMKYGLAVTGRIDPGRILTNAGAQPGDALVLTKALGTGIVATAFKLDSISDDEYEEVTESMLALNKDAAKVALEHGANACTDITGFGFLGHAWEMAWGSKVGMVAYASEIPVLSGALRYAAAGHLTRGDRTNREYVSGHVIADAAIPEESMRVFFDAQTSGGLLISLPAERAEDMVTRMQEQNIDRAKIIGRVTEENPGKITVVRS